MTAQYTDDKIIVYLGYPVEVHEKPSSWIGSMLRSESTDIPNSPFRFFLSGGVVTSALLELLKSRAAVTGTARSLAVKLSQGYPARLIDSLLSPEIEQVLSYVAGSPLSTEYRILLDLWVLSRSDVYLVDCDLLGRARCGMEAVYAQHCVPTVGISDSPVVDPWFQYHLDALIKSQMALSHLHLLRSAILERRTLESSLHTDVEEDPTLV